MKDSSRFGQSTLWSVCLGMFVFTSFLTQCYSQSIIYSITRCNSSHEQEERNQVPTVVTTTTSSTLQETQNESPIVQEGSDSKIYVRSKRFMQNKMPRPSNLQQSNRTSFESGDLKDSTKNISLVLAALLDNYDYNQRPAYGGPPAVITTNLEIRSMGPISELDMEYSLDCYFRQKWQDERLGFTGSANFLSLNIKMLDKIWKPDTYFHTGKGSHLHLITTPNKFLRIFKNGSILYSMRLTIKSLCPMDLHSFPMDKQSCPLILGSYGYPNNQLVYSWDTDPVTFYKADFALSQFDIINNPYRNGTFIFKRGNHSMLQVNFNLRRHVGYFLIQIYVPCSLIVVLSWVSFWINREATADRVGLGVTAVLTLSTFGLDSRSDLPRVSYATALDWYTIMCFLFVVFTLLEFAGVHYFTKVGTGEVPFIEIDDDWTKSSSEDENDNWEEEKRQISTQAERWKSAANKLKRNRLRPQVRSRRFRAKGKLSRGHNKSAPNEFEMQCSNLNRIESRNFKVNVIGNHLPTKPITYDSYHMPYCPKNPDYVKWRNDVKLDHGAPIDDQMSNLENYVNKRLRHNSNMNLIYPKNDYNPSTAYSESNFLKQTSSWPTLVWSDLIERNNLPWSMTDLTETTFEDNQSEDSEEDYDVEHNNGHGSLLKSLVYSISLCCLQFWYCFTSNEKYKLEMKRRRPRGQGLAAVNSVSKIDKVSRIMFPLIFFILNVFYWSFYINERNTEFNQWE